MSGYTKRDYSDPEFYKQNFKRQLDLMDAGITKDFQRHNDKCFPNNTEKDIKMH